MDAYLESNAFEEDDDPNRYVEPSKPVAQKNDVNEDVLKTRTYNLHITYDKYYQVPRFWLIGYGEDMKLLTIEEMKEDFSQVRYFSIFSLKISISGSRR